MKGIIPNCYLLIQGPNMEAAHDLENNGQVADTLPRMSKCSPIFQFPFEKKPNISLLFLGTEVWYQKQLFSY